MHITNMGMASSHKMIVKGTQRYYIMVTWVKFVYTEILMEIYIKFLINVYGKLLPMNVG